MENRISGLSAGAAVVNITPKKPLFLYGYPFVERQSIGVHDWLLSSALFISDGINELMFIANDVIFISKASTARIRKHITEKTGIPEKNILISATHTHSGPVTVDCIISGKDTVVPKVDKEYLHYLESGIADAACNAYKNAVPAEIGFIKANGTGIGTNRHDPSGPSDMEVPAMAVRASDTKDYIACMMITSMHPTVLHEDSKWYSGDFLSYAREILQKEYLKCECPVLCFTGAAGNQSPRHVTKANTFEEARRLGNIVATSVGNEIQKGIEFISDVQLSCLQKKVDLPGKQFPLVTKARKHLEKSTEKMEMLKNSNDKQAFRTAEVDWFGAIELLLLSELSESNALDEVYKSCLPAEIQVMKVGHWKFVSWPGEIFVEYALELKKAFKDSFLITLSNGELQGYIVTKEANDSGFYEASNSIFDYRSGQILLDETLQMLGNC